MADQLADNSTLNMAPGIRDNDSSGTDPPRTGDFELQRRRENVERTGASVESSTSGWRNPQDERPSAVFWRRSLGSMSMLRSAVKESPTLSSPVIHRPLAAVSEKLPTLAHFHKLPKHPIKFDEDVAKFNNQVSYSASLNSIHASTGFALPFPDIVRPTMVAISSIVWHYNSMLLSDAIDGDEDPEEVVDLARRLFSTDFTISGTSADSPENLATFNKAKIKRENMANKMNQIVCNNIRAYWSVLQHKN